MPSDVVGLGCADEERELDPLGFMAIEGPSLMIDTPAYLASCACGGCRTSAMSRRFTIWPWQDRRTSVANDLFA